MLIPIRHSHPQSRSAWRTIVALAVLAASTSLPLRSNAALAPPAKEPVTTPPAGHSITAESQYAPDALIGDLNFPGGTVKQYVEAVEAAIKPRPLNVMFYDQAAQVLVGAVRLRSISVGTAMRMLNSEIANNSVKVQYTDGKVPGDQGVYFLRGQMNAVDANLLRSLTTRAFSLREWTVAESPDAAPLAESRRAAALGAIEQGLSFGVESNPGPYFKPVVRYHPESGLLFVRANGEDQQIAESIVKQLDESFRGAEDSKRDSGRLQAMAQKIAGLQRELEEARTKLDSKGSQLPTTVLVPIPESIQAKAIAIATTALSRDSVVVGTALEFTPTQLGVQVRGAPDRVSRAQAALIAAAAAISELGAGQQPKP